MLLGAYVLLQKNVYRTHTHTESEFRTPLQMFRQMRQRGKMFQSFFYLGGHLCSAIYSCRGFVRGKILGLDWRTFLWGIFHWRAAVLGDGMGFGVWGGEIYCKNSIEVSTGAVLNQKFRGSQHFIEFCNFGPVSEFSAQRIKDIHNISLCFK